MPSPTDELVQAIRWRLGLPCHGSRRRAQAVWDEFTRSPSHTEEVTEICRVLAESTYHEALRYRLDLLRDQAVKKREQALLDSLAKSFAAWAAEEKALQRVTQILGRVVRSFHPDQASSLADTAPPATPKMAAKVSSRVSPQPRKEDLMNPEPAPASQAPQWKHLPLPEHEPDLHTESDQQTGQSPQGWPIIGARVRGKKHKHEGTNCDDWFASATSGEWTILAVADGAGSKRFSRVGARAATTAAVASLARDLAEQQVRARDDWSSASFQEDDLLRVEQAVRQSLLAAWDAVQEAAASRAASEAHRHTLGRDLTVADLSTTLLVAVHCTVRSKDEWRSLVFGCSVGDGMIAGIGPDGVCRLLMTPDSGEHSGETRFLEGREITPGKLRQRMFPFLGPLKALLLMTDGVADDYFPNDPGLSYLYGDLVLNGILPCPSSESAMAAALARTQLPTSQAVAAAEYWTLVPNAAAVGTAPVRIRSLQTFAEQLGLAPEQVVRSPALLSAGGLGDCLGDETSPSARLRRWLDAYQVRGSFDDRTLLILYR